MDETRLRGKFAAEEFRTFFNEAGDLMSWYNPASWFRKKQKRSYEGAAKGRRFSNWAAGGASANTEISAGAALLRERSRDLLRNNAYAAAAVRALVSNIIGEGIRPASATGDRDLDVTIDKLWRRWQKDASGALPVGFYGLQSLAVRSFLESGEVLIRRRSRRVEDRLAVPMQIQILEADQLDGQMNKELNGGARIVQGVEFSPTEKLQAYHLLRRHPGETSAGLRGVSRETVRVIARDVAHLYEPTRPGQVRGVPWLAPAIRRFRDLDDYEDAELMRKKVEACVSAFVYSTEEEEEGVSSKLEDADGNIIETLEPGLVSYLRGGKQVVFNQPHAVGGYDAYKRAELQSIAAAVGLTYELLSGDLSKVNFSSIRAGLIEFRRMIRSLRSSLVIPMICDPVWLWFIEAGIASGEIPAALRVTRGEVTLADAFGVKWSAPRFEEVDRAKDAKADLAELQAGTTTLIDLLAKRGVDWLDYLAAQVEIKADLEARGLSLTSISFTDETQTSEEPDAADDDEDAETDESEDPAEESDAKEAAA
jgi:lambda family phage portal protein